MPELSFLTKEEKPTISETELAEQVLPPIAVDLYALEPVKSSLAVYEGQFKALLDEAEAVTIVDDGSNAEAVAVAGKVKDLAKQIEKLRKGITEAPYKFMGAVNRLAKDYTEKLDRAERGIKQKIGQYQAKQELERRMREEAQRKAAAEIQARLNAEAAKEGVEPVKLQPVPEPAPPKTVRTESGSATIVEHWTFEIQDPTKIPREFMMPDEKKIRQAVTNGLRELDGVRIYEDSQVRIRS